MCTNEDHYFERAIACARRATCHRAKCGVIIVQDGEVIGEGYNAPPQDREEHRMCTNKYGESRKPKSDRTCCVHAEWRAIMDALKRHGDRIHGSTLYFARVNNQGEILYSGDPYCTVCSRLALDVGIVQFVLWHESGIQSYTTSEYNRLSYAFHSPHIK